MVSDIPLMYGIVTVVVGVGLMLVSVISVGWWMFHLIKSLL